MPYNNSSDWRMHMRYCKPITIAIVASLSTFAIPGILALLGIRGFFSGVDLTDDTSRIAAQLILQILLPGFPILAVYFWVSSALLINMNKYSLRNFTATSSLFLLIASTGFPYAPSVSLILFTGYAPFVLVGSIVNSLLLYKFGVLRNLPH